MPYYIKGFLLNRLLIFLAAVFTPIYFTILLLLSDTQMLSLMVIPNIYLNIFFNFMIAPIILSSPWLILIYNFRNRLANMFSVWAEKIAVVPLRYLLFYGINALAVTGFFILPLISPALSVFTALAVSWQLIAGREKLWLKSRSILVTVSIIVFSALLFLPVLVSYFFYQAYLPLSAWLLETWQSAVGFIYAFSIWIVNSLTIGSTVWFIYNLVVSRKVTDAFTGSNSWIRVLEVSLFIIFAYLWIPQLGNMSYVIDYINVISLLLMAVLIILKLKFKVIGGNFSFFGVIVAAGFLTVDLLYRFNIIILTGSLVFTSIIFFTSFIYAFTKSSDEPYMLGEP
ncbi:MAG: hypothetical protein OdinLCB4_006175 [Candidatus Odinarchaeum yellowstonii]|uniref:Uncharacterized protein n=1 Tax=Odinarchaeota yellowstonii (strain LCB_4) TaxID=1841599 RepID=A0AAF0D1R5_ODILC|nr:MAG: hypothetical protein OdinLCB4_006175 [Candidatus Odinarchaeum yellowstonii]